MELNDLKNILYQAESQVTWNTNDLDTMQQKYKMTQEETERIQKQIVQEEHQLLVCCVWFLLPCPYFISSIALLSFSEPILTG